MNISNLWASSLFCFAVFAVIWALGDIIAVKSKGYISGIVVGAAVYLFGFISGIIPRDIIGPDGASLGSAIANSTMSTAVSAWAMALLITNLGTIIDMDQLIKEWKTVVVALCALVGIAAISFTASTALFGREYALSAASPLSGGLVAGILTTNAAQAAGKPEFGAFAMLCVAFQNFVGLPVASFTLKNEARKLMANGGRVQVEEKTTAAAKKFNICLLPELPATLNTSFVIIAKMAIVVVIANLINIAVPAINVNILYLLCGIVACEIGFLDKQALNKANANGMVMLAMMAPFGASFATLDLNTLGKMVLPLIGCLILGAAGAMIVGVIAGKFVGWGANVAMAVSVTCLIGYPGTQIITDEVCKTLDCDDEMKARVKEYILPKMIVGGFVTVTIASVIFAGIVTPMIFR